MEVGVIIGIWIWDIFFDWFSVDDGFVVVFGIFFEKGLVGLKLEDFMWLVYLDDCELFFICICEVLVCGGVYVY